MIIDSSMNGNGPVIYEGVWDELPLADVPMPENVKNFKEIFLSIYEEHVLRFLQEFHRNSLFANANVRIIQFGSNIPLLAFMANFMPFLTNVNSIDINGNNRNFLPFLQNRFPEMAMQMLTSARVLKTGYDSRNDWFCDWLHIPRADGKPRVLCLSPDGLAHRLIDSFIEHIKEDFLAAKQAISFFIYLDYFRDVNNVDWYTLENEKTNEKLVLNVKGNFCKVSISRYPNEANAEWIEEMAKYEYYNAYRIITIYSNR